MFVILFYNNINIMKYSFYPIEGSDMIFGVPHNRPATYNKLNTGAKRAVIASRKRIGDVTKVAKKTGFSVPYVSQVLNMQYNNSRIVNAAYDIARGRKKNSEKNASL
jgi:hypothetical protein